MAPLAIAIAALPAILASSSASPAEAGGGAAPVRGLSSAAQDAPAARDAPAAVRVPIHGTIELGVAPFVERALEEAAAAGAAAVILELDTPGGRVDAAWAIVDAVRDAEVPVHAWINPRALSAGAMIALSADRIVMRPGATIGAATPVTGEGQRAPEKMVSAMRSEFRALAEARGLDPRIAEAMVDESIEVEGVVEAGKLLTLTTEEALGLGVASAVADDLEAALAALGVAGATVLEATPNWAEQIVRFLTHPAVAPMLLSLGFLGLLIEIKTPTFGVAGAVGLGALAAFFGAHHLVHLAGLEEIILFGVGVVLVAAEVFVIPGFGVAGILGGLAMFGGAALAMVGSMASAGDVINALGLVALSLILVAIASWAVLRHLPRSRRLSGVFLRESTSRETGYLSAPARADLVGKLGLAATDLRPAGTAVIGDERVDVVTEGPWIEAGTRIRVLRAEGYRHVVRALDPEQTIDPAEAGPEAPEGARRPGEGHSPGPEGGPAARVEAPEETESS